MYIEEMKKQIKEKCDEQWRCTECPLCNEYICFNTDDYDVIQENYDLMFPKERKRKVKGEDMDENYAVIDGEKIILHDKITEMILENQTNCKIYNIENIQIRPNWYEGYIKDSNKSQDGAVYIADDVNGISITHKELPKVIEALTEINNYIVKSKGENENEI